MHGGGGGGGEGGECLISSSVAPFTKPRLFQNGCPMGNPAHSSGSVLTSQALSDISGVEGGTQDGRGDAGSHQVPRGAEEAGVCPTHCPASGQCKVPAPRARQLWLSSGPDLLALMVCQNMSSSKAGAAPSERMAMAPATDQEACLSLDHGSKPSTQWVHLGHPPLGRGEPKGPPPPIRNMGRRPPGAGGMGKGGWPIPPACTEDPHGHPALSCACHGRCPALAPHTPWATPSSQL